MYAKLIVWRLGAEYRDGPGYETADGAYSAWHNVVSKPEYGAAGELELIFHPISRGDDLPMVGEMTALEDGKKAETLKSRLARPDGEYLAALGISPSRRGQRPFQFRSGRRRQLPTSRLLDAACRSPLHRLAH